MASTANLRGTKVATGQAQKEETINALFDLLDAAGHGKLDVTITTADVTLTGTPAAPQAQNKYFNLSGTLTGNRSLVFPLNDDDPAVGNPRVIVVKNGTAGAFTVTVKVSGQTGVTVTQGYTAILLHNGTDFVKLYEVNHTTGVISTANLGGAWTSWVPTWTSLSLGNGTVEAKYIQIGKLVICRLHLVWGSTTSISGGVSFTLPVTQLAYGGSAFRTPLGNAMFFDASVGGSAGQFAGDVLNESTTKAYLTVRRADGTYSNLADLSSTVPFTWTTSDEIHCQFEYEAA